MDVMQAIRQRRSIRKYADRPVPPEVLDEIMHAARLAPSARNLQEWKFVVVRDQALRHQLGESSGYPFIAWAPVIIAGVSLAPDRVMSCEVPAYAVDLAIAMTNITLAAVEKGLGTCWIGGFSQQKVRDVLRVPDDCKVVELMPLGYPAEEPNSRPRKSLDEVLCFDTWQ